MRCIFLKLVAQKLCRKFSTHIPKPCWFFPIVRYSFSKSTPRKNDWGVISKGFGNPHFYPVTLLYSTISSQIGCFFVKFSHHSQGDFLKVHKHEIFLNFFWPKSNPYMPLVNFWKKFGLVSFDFRQNFEVRTFTRWLSIRGTKFFLRDIQKLFSQIFTIVRHVTWNDKDFLR